MESGDFVQSLFDLSDDFVSSANIRFERCIKFRKLPGERTDDFIRRILRSLPSARFIDESMLSMNLLDQDMQSGVQAVADKEAKRVFAMIQSAGMARKQRSVNVLDGLPQPRRIGQRRPSVAGRKNALAARSGLFQFGHDGIDVPCGRRKPRSRRSNGFRHTICTYQVQCLAHRSSQDLVRFS